MLKNYINSVPFTKFLIIEDSLQERDNKITKYILNRHLQLNENKIHYFVFQETFRSVRESFLGKAQVVLYDYISDHYGWDRGEEGRRRSLESVLNQTGFSGIVFLDSLAHVIYQYGLAETYRVMNGLKNKNGIHQIVTILHLDLLEDSINVSKMFKHLSTLNITMLPNLDMKQPRVYYFYKKIGGKIIKEIEEYYFENDSLVTKQIEKPDTKKLLENSTTLKLNPETLTTFKIDLSEEDKEAREQLVLPYLPKDGNLSNPGGGTIFYKLDEQDDWDEEDPDDDLDI